MYEEQNWHPLQSSKLQVKADIQRPIHLLTGVPPSCHFKLAWMLLCMLNYMCRACVGCHSPSSGVPVYAVKVRVSPVASQCGADSTKFLQWHSSVGLFHLSFSSGVPVYTGSTSGIPVYTGPASVHWLRVREQSHLSVVGPSHLVDSIFVKLQWRHMDIMTTHITGNSIVVNRLFRCT